MYTINNKCGILDTFKHNWVKLFMKVCVAYTIKTITCPAYNNTSGFISSTTRGEPSPYHQRKAWDIRQVTRVSAEATLTTYRNDEMRLTFSTP